MKASASESLSILMCSSCVGRGQPQQRHALAQPLQQRRQLLDDLGALVARSAWRWPTRSGRPPARFSATRVGVLRAVPHRGDGQHVGPDLEQELAHSVRTGISLSILRSSIVYWIAIVSLLLDLLGHADQPLGVASFSVR